MGGLTRRSAALLSVAAPSGMGFPLGGEIDQAMVGINVRLAWMRPQPKKDDFGDEKPKQWCVWLPDWENQPSYWTPGMQVAGRWIALTEYLQTLETEFKLA